MLWTSQSWGDGNSRKILHQSASTYILIANFQIPKMSMESAYIQNWREVDAAVSGDMKWPYSSGACEFAGKGWNHLQMFSKLKEWWLHVATLSLAATTFGRWDWKNTDKETVQARAGFEENMCNSNWELGPLLEDEGEMCTRLRLRACYTTSPLRSVQLELRSCPKRSIGLQKR